MSKTKTADRVGHIPTPYDISDRTIYALNDEGTNAFSATIEGDGQHQTSEETVRATAEFIVRACNAHDDLLAILQSISMLYQIEQAIGPARWKQLALAIAKAEGR